MDWKDFHEQAKQHSLNKINNKIDTALNNIKSSETQDKLKLEVLKAVYDNVGYNVILTALLDFELFCNDLPLTNDKVPEYLLILIKESKSLNVLKFIERVDDVYNYVQKRGF